ncbi:hypothetical protein [Streptomyces arenae]|uniref:hypothetical protein n=1 Tax=Streptomyces arenae TaxID=29301 RepID=UPI0026581EE5|nr:hypothetical protein [Streptomyces arenae]MCG7205972.1 hypothetical protein [Streptomyces arenae]
MRTGGAEPAQAGAAPPATAVGAERRRGGLEVSGDRPSAVGQMTVPVDVPGVMLSDALDVVIDGALLWVRRDGGPPRRCGPAVPKPLRPERHRRPPPWGPSAVAAVWK